MILIERKPLKIDKTELTKNKRIQETITLRKKMLSIR